MQVRARNAPSPAAPQSPLTVEDTVPSESGSWRRSLEKEVPIAELQKKFGWAEGSWQADLLKAADGASTSPASRRGNGGVSAAEVDRYLAQPEDSRFLTSTAVQQQREALEQRLTGGTRSVDVDAFDTGWQETVARRADQLSGNADGKLSRAELNTFFTDVKQGKVEGTAWMPDQKQAVFESKVAESAGEVDPLRPTGADSGLSLVKEYMRLSMDEAKNVPTFVSYMLSAADIQETPVEVSRDKSHFHRDPELGTAGVVDSDYTGSGFDRGHMKPAEGSPTQEAMDESHLMSNVAPQHPDLNRQAWRTLEDAVNDLVLASGGKAHIITGNLYLNAQGKPLPPEAIDTLGANTRRIAVPTHQFKSVLLELPNGNLSMFAYMVPNVKDAPTTKDGITPFLEASRTSVDALEGLLGQDLYSQLPEALQARLESDASARVSFQQSSRYEAASLLWPQR
ncbi:DNA/RNA non-specific endonuclease [Stigmatella sp. ncwal1]|uniref:DNA/RNA non-specific endonuclease n=1 Tax=Stigmatella ashevillensis TaxID=2995309 RepID=A0ABT5DC70_9BACT|nr:DNA/RNA non-specific endonuclease [Stigmatella ashevillena]MDC0711270.1 DNA/RNA non-specific endonuclease [Stigmatella ashevillena]